MLDVVCEDIRVCSLDAESGVSWMCGFGVVRAAAGLVPEAPVAIRHTHEENKCGCG